MTEVFHVFKLITFLLPCAQGGVVPHERGEYAQCEETQQQVPCCVRAEAAEVSSCIEESAHIE